MAETQKKQADPQVPQETKIVALRSDQGPGGDQNQQRETDPFRLTGMTRAMEMQIDIDLCHACAFF